MKMKQICPTNSPDDAEIERAAGRLREINASMIVKKIGYTERRNLTTGEWEEIKTLVEKFSFPCNLYGAAYGFVFIVNDHGPMQGMRTDVLLAVENGEFPFPSCEKGFEGQLDTLEALKPITHRPRNVEVLDWYGFAPLHSRLETYTY